MSPLSTFLVRFEQNSLCDTCRWNVWAFLSFVFISADKAILFMWVNEIAFHTFRKIIWQLRKERLSTVCALRHYALVLRSCLFCCGVVRVYGMFMWNCDTNVAVVHTRWGRRELLWDYKWERKIKVLCREYWLAVHRQPQLAGRLPREKSRRSRWEFNDQTLSRLMRLSGSIFRCDWKDSCPAMFF